MLQIPEPGASARKAQFQQVKRILLGIIAFPLIQTSVPAGQNITLMWNPSPGTDVSGYAIYRGTNSGAYTTRFDAGNRTSLTVSNLTAGVNYYFVATAYIASGLESLPSNEIAQTVEASTNAAPTITGIPNQTIDSGGSAGPLSFRILDLETIPASLTVTSSSSNPQLVPAGNLVFGGYSSNRTITVSALAGLTGSAVITVLVSDGELSASSLFTVNVVNPPPVVALISPADGAAFTLPAAITLSAGVTPNGHSIAAVDFYDSGTLLGELTTAPFTLTRTNWLPGNHTLTARVLYDSGSVMDSTAIHVVVSGLPAPWQSADIGTIIAGSATESRGLYLVQGAGNLSGAADNFSMVYQPLSGNGEIKTRLYSMENTGVDGRIGVIIRESLNKGSRYAFVGASPDGRFRWQFRNATGGKTSSTTSTTGTPPNAWTRLTRTGNTLAGYRSIDGTNWALVSSRNISMATNIYVGFAVASGKSNLLNAASFTNVIVVP